MIRILLLLAIALGASGCTSTMKVTRVKAAPETRTGVVYQLPYSRFDVTVTRVVTACEPTAITLETSAEVGTAATAPDPSQTFTVDNNSLNGVFRIGAVKAEYGKLGQVKSFNATAEDRTAQVISSLVSGVFKIASLRLPGIGRGAETGVMNNNKPPPEIPCSGDVTKTLAAITAATTDLGQASAQAKAAANSYLTIQTRVAALGGVVDEATRKQLVAARTLADLTASAMAGKKGVLDRLKGSLTDTQAFSWPPDGSTFAGSITATVGLMDKWKNPNYKGPEEEPGAVLLRLAINTPDKVFQRPADDQDDPRGLPYRMPRPGYLYVCDADCSPKGQLAVLPAHILQVGTTFFLPCESQTFGSTSCAFTSDESGVPTSVGTERKTSAAETLANLGKDVAGQYVAAREARRDAQQKAYVAETERLKARADYEKALAALRTDPNKAVVDATATYKVYTEYHEAAKAYEDAVKAAAPPI